ncbi:unnamed protein product [Linum tenue]|uniref:Allene oxide synthase n=6 Tax=Linum tenue TaxID=586396 RepID=A0AAV0MLA5_9ROSI|nr:unnamed protein product [Linum tenue]
MSPPPSSPPELPLKPIPGSYGLPFLGPMRDRLAYFYYQGTDEYFASRIRSHNYATVIRTNMPPGPFVAADSRVVALLDAASFPVLFDNSKVEKMNVLDGTYVPSVDFTGGLRMLAFLDTRDPKHALLKSLVMSFLASKRDAFIPLFRGSLSRMFGAIDGRFAATATARVNFNGLSEEMVFGFLFRLFCDDKDPFETAIGTRGPAHVDKWNALQVIPITAPRLLPKSLSFIEDFFLHTFPFPFSLVKSDYSKLYAAFNKHAETFLDRAESSFGIPRAEACHNLVFIAGFNAYGGFKPFFPSLIKWVASAGHKLHRQLAGEIRAVVLGHGGEVTLGALDAMTLTKSVVYEALRIEPPIPFQYGRAREDMVVRSHDAAYEVKKGEMLFGYQPFATRDPTVFDRPEEFVGDRFVGGRGEKKMLLRDVYWSNGRETDDPTAENKQCPAKDLVVLMSRVLLVELFLRYDGLTVEIEPLPLGSSVTITSLDKATSV